MIFSLIRQILLYVMSPKLHLTDIGDNGRDVKWVLLKCPGNVLEMSSLFVFSARSRFAIKFYAINFYAINFYESFLVHLA